MFNIVFENENEYATWKGPVRRQMLSSHWCDEDTASPLIVAHTTHSQKRRRKQNCEWKVNNCQSETMKLFITQHENLFEIAFIFIVLCNQLKPKHLPVYPFPFLLEILIILERYDVHVKTNQALWASDTNGILGP